MDRIGEFTIEDRLGRHGDVTVVLGRHHKHGTLHDLRVVRLPQGGAAELMDEARLLQTLKHPSLLSIDETFTHNDTVVLVSEHLDSFTLREALNGGAMAVDEAVDLFRQILEGVGAAHRAGITHSGLKPEHILLTAEGDRVRARVADFGIGRYADDGAPTLAYTAPEQLEPVRSDHRVDIFSLGAIFYEMLAGIPAFSGPDDHGLIKALTQGQYEPVERSCPACPSELSGAIARALQTHPRDRFGSCEAFLGALPQRPEAPARNAASLDTQEDVYDFGLSPDQIDTQTDLRVPELGPPAPVEPPQAAPPQAPPPQAPPPQAPPPQAPPPEAPPPEAPPPEPEPPPGGAPEAPVAESALDFDTYPSGLLPPREPQVVPAALLSEQQKLVFQVVALLLLPVIGLLVGAQFTLSHAASGMEVERTAALAAERTLDDNLDRLISHGHAVLELGGSPDALEHPLRRAEAATATGDRVEAAQLLNMAVSNELRRISAGLPPEQIAFEREVERTIKSVRSAVGTYKGARAAWEDIASGTAGSAALALDRAEPLD